MLHRGKLIPLRWSGPAWSSESPWWCREVSWHPSRYLYRRSVLPTVLSCLHKQKEISPENVSFSWEEINSCPGRSFTGTNFVMLIKYVNQWPTYTQGYGCWLNSKFIFHSGEMRHSLTTVLVSAVWAGGLSRWECPCPSVSSFPAYCTVTPQSGGWHHAQGTESSPPSCRRLLAPARPPVLAQWGSCHPPSPLLVSPLQEAVEGGPAVSAVQYQLLGTKVSPDTTFHSTSCHHSQERRHLSPGQLPGQWQHLGQISHRGRHGGLHGLHLQGPPAPGDGLLGGDQALEGRHHYRPEDPRWGRSVHQVRMTNFLGHLQI